MKKSLTKLIVSCAAVTAVAAAMAVTASAANYDTGVTEITNSNAVPAAAGKQATILVQKKTDTALTEGDIFYIDQNEAAAANWATIKFAEGLEDGDYVIKMGGEGVTEIVSEEFTVGKVIDETEDVLLGNVNRDKDETGKDIVDYQDATIMLEADAGLKTLTDDEKLLANINKDDVVDYSDATAALEHDAGIAPITETVKVAKVAAAN